MWGVRLIIRRCWLRLRRRNNDNDDVDGQKEMIIGLLLLIIVIREKQIDGLDGWFG